MVLRRISTPLRGGVEIAACCCNNSFVRSIKPAARSTRLPGRPPLTHRDRPVPPTRKVSAWPWLRLHWIMYGSLALKTDF